MRVYVSIDGDDIGRGLTEKIYTSSDEEISEFSREIVDIFLQIASWVEINSGRVYFCAGDSVLLSVDDSKIESLLNLLHSVTIINVSVGIGNSIREAHWSLNVAKSLGKNRVIYFHEIWYSILKQA